MIGYELGADEARGTGAIRGEGRVEVEGDEVEGAVVSGGVEVDGALDPLALDLWVPGKVIEGSSRFHQFFII